MTTYAVIRKADQAEVFRYGADAPVEWTGLEFAEYDHVEVVEPVAPPVPAPVYVWTVLDFMRRFTPQERISARTLEQSDPIAADFLDLLRQAPEVQSDSAEVAAGLGYLVQQGVLTVQRRDEILGTA